MISIVSLSLLFGGVIFFPNAFCYITVINLCFLKLDLPYILINAQYWKSSVDDDMDLDYLPFDSNQYICPFIHKHQHIFSFSIQCYIKMSCQFLISIWYLQITKEGFIYNKSLCIWKFEVYEVKICFDKVYLFMRNIQKFIFGEYK